MFDDLMFCCITHLLIWTTGIRLWHFSVSMWQSLGQSGGRRALGECRNLQLFYWNFLGFTGFSISTDGHQLGLGCSALKRPWVLDEFSRMMSNLVKQLHTNYKGCSAAWCYRLLALPMFFDNDLWKGLACWAWSLQPKERRPPKKLWFENEIYSQFWKLFCRSCEAAFLADTGPGFFTRATMRALSLGEERALESDQNQVVLVLAAYPLISC